MFRITLTVIVLWCGVFNAFPDQAEGQTRKQPLRALLIAGGCCHDYQNQIEIIKQGLAQRANIEFEVFHGFNHRDRQILLYQTADWAKGFDVVIHNECYGGVTDVEFVERLVKGHTVHKVPLVAIHCSMHSYRNAKTDAWRKLLGVTSVRHERGGVQLNVVNRKMTHPVMKQFPGNWETPNGELYVIEKAWPNTELLATAFGVGTQRDQPVIWVNEFEGVRVFGTTLGHHNETMMSKEWLDVVARGVLWSCDQLKEDGSPKQGYEGSGVGPIWLPKTAKANLLKQVWPTEDAQTPTPAQPKSPTPARKRKKTAGGTANSER